MAAPSNIFVLSYAVKSITENPERWQHLSSYCKVVAAEVFNEACFQENFDQLLETVCSQSTGERL